MKQNTRSHRPIEPVLVEPTLAERWLERDRRYAGGPGARLTDGQVAVIRESRCREATALDDRYLVDVAQRWTPPPVVRSGRL